MHRSRYLQLETHFAAFLKRSIFQISRAASAPPISHSPMTFCIIFSIKDPSYGDKLEEEIIDPPVPKDMSRLVFFVKPVFFAREGVAF